MEHSIQMDDFGGTPTLGNHHISDVSMAEVDICCIEDRNKRL